MITKLTDSTDDGYYEELDPAWSPDGTTIAVSSNLYGDWDVWLVDAQGGGYKLNLTSANLGWDDYPAFGN
jgi:Tol biopolymer transport system component